MKIITTTKELEEFCAMAEQQDYVTIDTEFLREKTYYSKLCLIQLAVPPALTGEAVLVDTLADGIKLDPIYRLFQNKSVVKVFHAARQDLEIFFHDQGILPEPFFDTQIAAMVCGYGDQVGYETLVRKIAKSSLDKSSRFTDWSARPLSAQQQNYAVADVTHLRVIYEGLSDELERSNRHSWLLEEEATLLDPATYALEPANAWKRVKLRSAGGKMLAAIITLAEFRENFAQTTNIPRNRVFKDEALLEIAATRPDNIRALSKSRLLPREARKGKIADGILSAIKNASKLEKSDLPKINNSRDKAPAPEGVMELLRVLLKAKSEQMGVAPKLIANVADLEKLALGEQDLKQLSGWRREVFGGDALRLIAGEVALVASGKQVKIVELE